MFNIPTTAKPPLDLNSAPMSRPQYNINTQQGTVFPYDQQPMQSMYNQPQQYSYSQTQQSSYSQQPSYSQPQSQPQQSSYSQPQQPSYSQPQQQQSSYNQPQGTGVNLKKGQKVSLAKREERLNRINACLGWNISNTTGIGFDLDTEVFMLNNQNKVVGDSWFVFYNQTISPDGSVKHMGDNKIGSMQGDAEVISVELDKVNPAVDKLVFVVTINEALERRQNFSQVSNAYIRIVNGDSGVELIRFNLSDYYQNVVSMVVGEIYKRNGEWKFNPIGDGTADDLEGLCIRYGVGV